MFNKVLSTEGQNCHIHIPTTKKISISNYSTAEAYQIKAFRVPRDREISMQLFH